MKMKRLIALLCVGALLMTGCGKAAEETGDDTAAVSGSDTASTEVTSDITATATGTETVADETANTGAETGSATGTDTGAGADTSEAGADTAEATVTEAPQAPVHEQAKVTLKSPSLMNTRYKGDCGTIEKIDYMAHDYQGDGPDYEKHAYVYLPAGYDETKQYNVIYLMHGIGGSETEWGLNNAATSKVKNILDHLIGAGDIEPVIVVTPNGKALALSESSGNDYFYNYGYELRNDLIPYIESHYATYADYSEEGYDLTATRTHRAMAGLSMGGMQTINIGICECLDLFSWFGAFSAAPTSYPASKVSAAVAASEYSVDFFYNLCGKEDNIAYASASAAAKSLGTISDDFTKNKNFLWQEKTGAHNFAIWNLGFYNFALIAFNDSEKIAEVLETE